MENKYKLRTEMTDFVRGVPPQIAKDILTWNVKVLLQPLFAPVVAFPSLYLVLRSCVPTWIWAEVDKTFPPDYHVIAPFWDHMAIGVLPSVATFIFAWWLFLQWREQAIWPNTFYCLAHLFVRHVTFWGMLSVGSMLHYCNYRMINWAYFNFAKHPIETAVSLILYFSVEIFFFWWIKQKPRGVIVFIDHVLEMRAEKERQVQREERLVREIQNPKLKEVPLEDGKPLGSGVYTY